MNGKIQESVSRNGNSEWYQMKVILNGRVKECKKICARKFAGTYEDI